MRETAKLPRPWMAFLLLAIAGGVAYSNIYSCPFVFDSQLRILDNESIRQLWPPAWWAYSQRPIAFFTIALNYSIHGYDLPGYHVFNLAIHVAAACVLFLVVRDTLVQPRFTGRYEPHASALALAAALIWLLHPLQTQSVTYTVQRMESMMGLFYLLTMWCFMRAQRGDRTKVWLAASVVFCLLGVGSKEVIFSAPLVVLWYDRLFVGRSWAEIWSARRWYYAGLLGTWLVLFALLNQLFARYAGEAIAAEPVSSMDYAVSQPGVILQYLQLSFWPIGQCLDYDWPIARAPMEIVPPMMAIVSLLALTVWGMFRHRELAFLGGAFFLILAPTSSIAPIQDLAFEHRMYLPLAALCVLFVMAVHEAIGRTQARRAGKNATLSRMFPVTIGVVAAALGCLTYLRNQDYQSKVAVWADVVEKAPHNARGQHCLAFSYYEINELEKAIAYWRNALECAPTVYEAPHYHNDLANALREHGEYDEAIFHYQEALKLAPEMASAHFNFGNALFETNQIVAAIEHFRKTVELEPKNYEARLDLGSTLMVHGNAAEAIEHFEAAHQLKPDEVAPRENIARWHLQNARGHAARANWPMAVKSYERVLQLIPQSAETHFEMGMVRERQGNQPLAITHLREAVRLKPEFTAAADNLRRLVNQ